jgi:hypothetical protein
MKTYGREKIRGFRHGLREISRGEVLPYPRNFFDLERYQAFLLGWYKARNHPDARFLALVERVRRSHG